MKARTIAAGEFKQGCLAILDQVAETRAEVVITKRGRPVARIVPIEDDAAVEARMLARMRGSVRFLVSEEDLMQPLDEPWEALQDDRP